MYCTVQTECRIKELKYFDTHSNRHEADKLAKYIYYQPYGTHLIILTVGDAFNNMSVHAFDALCSVGIDISDVADKEQTFVALVVLGSHCQTMYELYEDEDLAYLQLQLDGKYNHHNLLLLLFSACCTSHASMLTTCTLYARGTLF